MNCSICNKKATVKLPYGEKNYCDKHFLELIEKRIRKDLRINEVFDLKKTYYIVDNKNAETEITKKILNKIFKNNLKIKEIKKINNKKTDKTNLIFPKSLDKEAEEFINAYFNNKDFCENYINPLRNVTTKEILEICRIMKITNKTEETSEFLKKLEDKYPGTLFSIRKSMDFIKK